jgi:CheY-like chemotaxis protein
MHILLLALNYWPDKLGNAPLMVGLCEGLVARGHRVTVVCAFPHHETGRIAPEHRAHVFEAFYTTKPESKGTGLGLATVVSIVEAHGGQVDFDTELGRGTVFRVWLPTVLAEQILAATDTVGAFEVTTAVRDGGAVLVVEDDPRILKNATRILRAAGHRVVGVASGTEAQRLAAETRFDVILMDAVMPGLSGPELYAALHAAQPRACVIVTMGFATNDFGRDFFDGGDRSLQCIVKLLTQDVKMQSIDSCQIGIL